jgi:hypothetical protein
VKIYSYVVDHDTGKAPNPYFAFCTLCRCKYRKRPAGRKNIVELAEPGDWVIGTGGASKQSAGHGKLIYAMLVSKKFTREEYYNNPKFAEKKPEEIGPYKQTQGDNEKPGNNFEKHEQYVLLSQHFYYFGKKAINIPEEFNLEKKGPGFRSDFDQLVIRRFVEWLGKKYKPGKHGEPCCAVIDELKGSRQCKLSC